MSGLEVKQIEDLLAVVLITLVKREQGSSLLIVMLKTDCSIGIIRSLRHTLKKTERCLTTEQSSNKIASLQRRSAV